MYAPTLSTPQRIKELIINRVSAGEECIITEYEGKIIHMNWIGFQNTHLFNPSYILKRGIGADEALSYNIYCAPEYRGNHIMGAVFSEIFNLLKRKCYQKLIGYVLPDNYASIKVVTKFLGKPVQTLHFLSIFGINISFLSKRSG
jgi:RimJ/RimL family protein N-acetyltransferase